MSLSSTAVPKYYGRFREDVIKGRIPVCEKISLEMNRIDDLIRNPNVYYDPAPVEGWIKFCESELVLTDGSPMYLLDSFKLWGEQLYGWYTFTDRSVYQPGKNGARGHYVRKRIKKRLRNKQYIIVARGAAKSVYAYTVQGHGLLVDPTTTHQVTTAPTMKQAEEIINPFKTAIAKRRGPLISFLTEGSLQNTTGDRKYRQKLASTKLGIQNFLTNSYLEVRSMSIDKMQGLQNKYSTLDEWLSGDVREDVIGALEQGASKVDDYIILAISSEGTVRNGIGDSIKLELDAILRGEYIAPNVSIFWYCLDDIKEVAKPDLWVKANPNIGVTVKVEAYQNDVERAEKVPSAANDILAKRFGIATEGYTYFFTYEETKKSVKQHCFWGLPCSLGADLSRGDDFCAFTFTFPLSRGRFGLKNRSYITEHTFMKLKSAMQLKYREFIKEGTLIVMPGVTLDMMEVYEDLDRHIIDCSYDVRTFGYDPYNAKEFVERWATDNGEIGIEKVKQGSQTESVPLGEIKNLAEMRMLLFDEDIMSFCLGNAIVLTDTNGNRKLYKLRGDDKIDNVASFMDSYIAYKRNPMLFE